MESALLKDIEGKYIEAVQSYEHEIAGDFSYILPDSYINLAFLYWSFAFELFEFNIPNNINDEYSIIGGNRYKIILDLGLIKFPNNIELHFWKKYFQHIIYGEEFSKNDCESLLREYGDNKTIVPYFFLYLFDKEKYKGKRNELLDRCNKYPTAKNIYIKSIID
ncbi:hypothetical protein SAMN05421780_101800 [Flexibacter flexilis DSM 6793]|uniref:Uncharacterized protein n=1 Tax=Flexibacter flexilis DSM 6793 TaxID=927664 RepID=A0A1I1EGR4_9BACT|nr:hypothetical protein [Flexibacter flexilis]SFB86281.1 hypothetical protein SAMN05421780_101800 [Flexibacter flexilis DSM 6793]